MLPNLKALLLCSCFISCAAFASECKQQDESDGLIFSSQNLRLACKNHQKTPDVVVREWKQSTDRLLQWTRSVGLSSKPHYRQAEEFYIKQIMDKSKDVARFLDKQNWEFFFPLSDHLSTLEHSLRVMIDDERIDPSDLSEEEFREVTRAVTQDEKIHPNRTIPPEKDRCFEAIVVKRTRLANSDTMIDMGSSELDIAALISFNNLSKFKHEETTDTGVDFTVSQTPSVNVKHNVNSKYVINVGDYQNIYQVTANSFYRGSDFRIKYNKGDGFLFLTDLTILGETASLKSVSQGTKSRVDPRLLKSLTEDDFSRLPGKIDLVFEFDLGQEKALAFQMVLKEKKTRLFGKGTGKDANEWIVNFVRSQDANLVMELMNNVLSKVSHEKSSSTSKMES